jgi:hypothetical protein
LACIVAEWMGMILVLLTGEAHSVRRVDIRDN